MTPKLLVCHFVAAILAQAIVAIVSTRCVTMDARTTAAVRAVNLVVGQANDAAVAENLRLRCAVERAVVAIEQGDRVVALRLLACALNQEPVPVPARICAYGHICAMCGVCKRTLMQMNAIGRWSMVPPVQRRLCMPCFHMQP